MKSLVSISKVFLFSIALVPIQLFGSAPKSVSIDKVVHGGTGCREGSVTHRLSKGGKLLRVAFDGFVVRVGANVSLREKRKFCQLNITLSYPPDWTYTISEVDTEGFFSLDEGVEGLQTLSYYFSNETTDIDFSDQVIGPYVGPVQTRARPITKDRYAPCGENKAVNLKTTLRLSKDGENFPDSRGLIAAGNSDGSLIQRYGIKWKKCDLATDPEAASR